MILRAAKYLGSKILPSMKIVFLQDCLKWANKYNDSLKHLIIYLVQETAVVHKGPKNALPCKFCSSWFAFLSLDLKKGSQWNNVLSVRYSFIDPYTPFIAKGKSLDRDSIWSAQV